MLRGPQVMASFTDRMIREGVFPSWRTANLILIPNAGKKNSFRPIHLLNTIAKGVETIINRRLQEELQEKDALSETQYGFRPGRSTLMAFDRVLETVERKSEDYGANPA